MKHDKKIMICDHIFDDYEAIGQLDDDIKSDTILCQKCIDQMAIQPFNPENLPKEVHFACKTCVLKELQGTVRKTRLIK